MYKGEMIDEDVWRLNEAGIVYEIVRVEISPGDSFLQIAYVKQSWTCAVDQNSLFCTVLPVFETVPLSLL